MQSDQELVYAIYIQSKFCHFIIYYRKEINKIQVRRYNICAWRSYVVCNASVGHILAALTYTNNVRHEINIHRNYKRIYASMQETKMHFVVGRGSI